MAVVPVRELVPTGEPSRAVPTRRGWVAFLVAVTLALAAAAVAHVWVRLRVLHLGYEISEMRTEEQRLSDQNRRLELEAAMLRQPGRIERIARDRLGMARPEPERIHIIRVRPGGPPLAQR